MALRYGANSGEYFYCNVSANRLPHTSTECESESNYTLIIIIYGFTILYLVFSFVVSELLIYCFQLQTMDPYAHRFTRRGGGGGGG